MARKILVVDDDPLAVRLMKLTLTPEGFDIVSATNALEGFSAAQTERPDLIILDIMMPDMDGVEMCRHLRGRPETANTPIIFLTAKTQLDDKVQGLRAGADDYITKPADPKEILARVEAVLARAKRVTAARQGRVVSVIGAKGGVGTSTIAANLGAGLAKRRLATALLDLHHHGGTLLWQLKLSVRSSLADLTAMPAVQIDSLLLERVLIAHSSGLNVLLSPPAGASLVELSAAHAGAIVRAARAMFDTVLLDLPHVLSPATKEALGLSDMALLVLTSDPTGVACAELAIPLLETAGLKGDTIALIVVNRTQSPVNLSVGDIERRLNRACFGAVPPAAEELLFADRHGVPLVLSESAGMATNAFRELADRMQVRMGGRVVPPR